MRTIALYPLLCLFLVTSCDDRSAVGSKSICCTDDGPPTFLKSKIDDDDGDGNPIDEDFPSVNDEDDDIADHTWVRDDVGTYHLFFQNEGHTGGNEIEHYTTNDLLNLEYVGVAMGRTPGNWDADGLWAPHVVRHEGTYFMFYTGVNGRGPNSLQRIGVATSTDLINWTRWPNSNCADTVGDGCIYECNECWTTWGQPVGAYRQQCRDPFVMWDDANRQWTLWATAKSDNQFGVITVATSSNLTDWRGSGYIDATRRLAAGSGGQPTGGQAENPFVMAYNGTYYLLFSDWQDDEDDFTVENPRTVTQYATSTTLAADSSGSRHWTYRGYIPDPGVNAIEVQQIDRHTWLMSQSISNEGSGDYDHRRALRLKCVTWGSDLSFDTANAKITPRLTRPFGPVDVPKPRTLTD